MAHTEVDLRESDTLWIELHDGTKIRVKARIRGEVDYDPYDQVKVAIGAPQRISIVRSEIAHRYQT